MKRTIVLLVNILILQIILSACNLPIATVTAPQPSDEQINTNQTAEAQSQIVQQTLQAQNSGSNLTISDVQVSVNTFYYLNDTCGPTEVTISAKVTSSALITNAGVLRLFNGDQKGPNGGQADAMTPIGNDRYAFTMNKQTDDLDSILRDNYSLELILYAEDTAGNQVATGDWGDAVGDGQPWPLNPIQLQIPTLRLEQCLGNANQVTTAQAQEQVNIPAATPTPKLETLPTNTPVAPAAAPSVQTRSNYAEFGDWYTTEETADMDFSGAKELAFMAANSDYPDHSLGQNVSQGEGIMMASVSSPSYDTCRAIPAWNTGIIVHTGETYCYLTAGGTYGYFHIDKIENRGSEIANWVIGLSYTVWVP